MKEQNLKGKSLVYLTILFSVVFITNCSTFSPPSQRVREYWPTKVWETGLLEKNGINQKLYEKAIVFKNEKLPNIQSLLVVKNGFLVFEKYYNGATQNQAIAVHSITKSVTSALIGIAIAKRHIKGVEQKIIDFFPEYISSNRNQLKKEIRLKHLLTMTAGLHWKNDWYNHKGVTQTWLSSKDWFEAAINLKQDHKPGELFQYSNAVSHLLSGVLSKTTKIQIQDFAQINLFDHLGVSLSNWWQDPQGNCNGAFGLFLTSRDMAKFGYLFLNNGFWEGKQVIPKYWVTESTKSHTGTSFFGSELETSYGYQWWVRDISDYSAYYALGRGGQYIVVIPKLDMLIVITSKSVHGSPYYETLFKLIVQSVKN